VEAGGRRWFGTDLVVAEFWVEGTPKTIEEREEVG
jgi:hypothetical protein